ncbi:MAG: DUF3175 domain-containing protein [Terriglobia bacterium]
MTDRKPKKYWSREVTRRSNALDLESGVFTWKDPKKIARSLSNSARKSTRRKGTPLQSSMSMLSFHINRGGKNLSGAQRKTLEQAKEELRRLFAGK